MHLTKAEIARFKSKRLEGSRKSCWEWLGAKYQTGYGMACIRRGPRKTFLAHRIAWIIQHGMRIPEEYMICHTCDNRACVNPHHLYAGTGYENNSDTINRGRGNRMKGSACTWSKLTDSDVLFIRSGQMRQCELARKFGMKQSSISNIQTGKNWKHLLPQKQV